MALYPAVIQSNMESNQRKRKNFFLLGSTGFRIRLQSAGLSVSALTVERETATEIVIPNWRYITPVTPERKQTGTNMARRTRVVAIHGPVTCRMVLIAASRGLMCSSSISRLTLSMTTMASSTTTPMARIRPKSVIRLMLNPITFMTANVPTRETGMAMDGTSVARQS